MRRMLAQSLIAVVIALLLGQSSARSQNASSASVTGEWELTSVEMGIPWSQRMLLTDSGGNVEGTVTGHRIVKGTIKQGEVRLEFSKSGESKPYSVYSGKISGTGMSGTYGDNGKVEGTWSAKKAASDKPASPRTLDFKPTQFYRELSGDIAPVLHIWPGDTVRTKSVDAGGEDETSVQLIQGGNPLTGPFYVEGAMPGDVLAITIKKLRINRDWAGSDSGLVDRAVTADYVSGAKRAWKNVRWHLDAEKQIAFPQDGLEHLKNFSVAIHPMLGCVAVAPNPWDGPLNTRDSGEVGGNMDYNEIAEGSTVLLGVQQPGALLFLGDAHAVQGDGELNGNALETSMDIEFSVEVRRDKEIGTPRVENSEYLMAVGLSRSLDDAFRVATSELASWLQDDYHLTRDETAILLGSAIEYKIAEVADRNAGVVAKIRKSSLASLSPKQ
jgi:amidase